MMFPRAPTWACRLAVLSLLCAGCGDSLSSLDVVRRQIAAMQLSPDFGRRGNTLQTTATLDESLRQALLELGVYPTEVSFGEGTHLKSFTTEENGDLTMVIFISPLAREGEREPTLLFLGDQDSYEARGSFWVLPSLP